MIGQRRKTNAQILNKIFFLCFKSVRCFVHLKLMGKTKFSNDSIALLFIEGGSGQGNLSFEV